MKSSNFTSKIVLMLVFLNICFVWSAKNDTKTEKGNRGKGKDFLYMSDEDLERISEQWEDDVEPLEADELPKEKKPKRGIDISKLDITDKDSIMEANIQEAPMMVVTMKDEVPEDQAQKTFDLWHSVLRDNHIKIERYPVMKRKEIYKFADGSQAVGVKNFLITQPEIARVILGNQNFDGPSNVEDAKVKTKKETRKTEL